jgi:phosphoglycolate phosphatase
VETLVLAAELDALFVRAAEFSVPVTDLPALFSRLKAHGLKLGIASSDNEKAIRRTVEHFGLSGYVDFVAGYDSGFGAKPGPGMFLAFCEAVGLAPGEVAMVGDNNHDMQMGRAGGAAITVAVLTGTGTRETLSAAADHCLDDITMLEQILRVPAGLPGYGAE